MTLKRIGIAENCLAAINHRSFMMYRRHFAAVEATLSTMRSYGRLLLLQSLAKAVRANETTA